MLLISSTEMTLTNIHDIEEELFLERRNTSIDLRGSQDLSRMKIRQAACFLRYQVEGRLRCERFFEVYDDNCHRVIVNERPVRHAYGSSTWLDGSVSYPRRNESTYFRLCRCDGATCSDDWIQSIISMKNDFWNALFYVRVWDGPNYVKDSTLTDVILFSERHMTMTEIDKLISYDNFRNVCVQDTTNQKDT